jgi:hypothetical protein
MDRIAVIDRLAHYLCRMDRTARPELTMEERWVLYIESYRDQAKLILDNPDGWKIENRLNDTPVDDEHPVERLREGSGYPL